MYKKYAGIFLLSNIVAVMAWLCVQGIVINQKAAEAFTVIGQESKIIQATSFLGVAQESVSEKRVIKTNVIRKKRNITVTQTEYENLLKLVEAEAGGEDLTGKMLVANVVLNRVENEQFPDTINDVIFQKNNGVTQFSPVSDGRFYSVKVSEETVKAVNLVLQGEDNSQGALYFVARQSADKESMKWFDEKLNSLFVYGGHEFFF